MLDRTDMAFAAALERSIRAVLNGDNDKPGLYQAILATNTWDDFNRTRATIIAYEIVLNMMRDVAKRMNEGEEPIRAQPQSRVN
jgi:hypothetical protein